MNITVKAIKKKFQNPFIPDLPYVLYTLMDRYSEQIKGILDQRYKKDKLIEYIMKHATYNHDKLPISFKKTYKYTITYLKENKHISYD